MAQLYAGARKVLVLDPYLPLSPRATSTTPSVGCAESVVHFIFWTVGLSSISDKCTCTPSCRTPCYLLAPQVWLPGESFNQRGIRYADWQFCWGVPCRAEVVCSPPVCSGVYQAIKGYLLAAWRERTRLLEMSLQECS